MAASYKHLTITVDWFGPYMSVGEAAAAAKEDFENGLYLVAGKRKSQHGKPRLQYVGIAKRLATRLFTSDGVKSVTRDRKIWLGEISSSAPPGKKTKATKPTIDLAEWAHAYFLGLPCNTKKRVNPPPRPVTVLNRWWKKDYETPARQRASDLIETGRMSSTTSAMATVAGPPGSARHVTIGSCVMGRGASEASLSQGDAFGSYASSPPEAALNLSGGRLLLGCLGTARSAAYQSVRRSL